MSDEANRQSPMWDLRRINERRSLLLCAAGAVIGLMIAGFGLFTAEGTRSFVVPPEDAALVNNVPILMTDLVGQVTTTYNTPYTQATAAQKHKILNDMIHEELLVQRGIELGLPTDDSDVRQALISGTESVVSQDATTESPGNDELHAWYDAHRQNYATEGEMLLHEYIVPRLDAVRAPAMVAALRAGASPVTLGLVSSRRVDDGEEFYFAAKLHLGERLFAIGRAMRNGEVSDPVLLDDGAHILVMVANQTPKQTPFAQVKDRVLHDIIDAKVKHLQAGSEQYLRRRADIQIAVPLR